MVAKLTIAFLAVFLFAGNIFAEDMTPENAKKILDKALKLQKTRSFTATTSRGEGKSRITQKIFQKLNPDGTTYKRIETKNTINTYIYIKNDSGRFEVYENSKIAVKSDYNTKFMNYDDFAKYTIKSGSFNSIPCYIISRTVKPSKALAERHIKLFPNRRHKIKRFLKNYPALLIYYIGKDNLFIYSRSAYYPNGRQVSKSYYKNVILNPKLADNVFQIPMDYQIKVAKNAKQDSAITGKILEKGTDKRLKVKLKARLIKHNSPGILTKTVYYFDSNFNSISSIISTILFWSAISLLIFIGIYKWKNKNK